MAIQNSAPLRKVSFECGQRLNRIWLPQPLVDISGQKFLTDVMSASIASLSARQLRRAADIKDQVQTLETELGQILGSSTKPAALAAPKRRRKMSAAGRARMSAAAKARWAKIRAEKD
jgi:hypothetical protein